MGDSWYGIGFSDGEYRALMVFAVLGVVASSAGVLGLIWWVVSHLRWVS